MAQTTAKPSFGPISLIAALCLLEEENPRVKLNSKVPIFDRHLITICKMHVRQ